LEGHRTTTKHDIHCWHHRPICGVILNTKEPDVDALQHLVSRSKAAQGWIHDLHQCSCRPVLPHLH
jgi:hypothetical protein